jgi:hypothetical protein
LKSMVVERVAYGAWEVNMKSWSSHWKINAKKNGIEMRGEREKVLKGCVATFLLFLAFVSHDEIDVA